MKSRYRKAYAYAYPSSPNAVKLGHAKTGCYYIERETRLEDGTFAHSEIWPGTHGEASATWKDADALRELYAEIDMPVSPYCLSKRK